MYAMDQKKKSTRMVEVQVRFPPSMLEQAERVAERDERSRSFVLRKAIEIGLPRLEG